MDEYAVKKGILWRLARTFLVIVALTYVLKLIGQELSFSDTAYGAGALVILILSTLSDRTDFYDFGPRPLHPDDESSEPVGGPPGGGPPEPDG